MSSADILAQVASGKLSVEEGTRLINVRPQTPLRCKVSAKGGVSLYGVNSRFPVTLYAEQWTRVLDYGDQIREFIKAQNGSLSSKDSPKAAA